MIEYKIDEGDWEAEISMKDLATNPKYTSLWLQIWYSIRYCEVASFMGVNFEPEEVELEIT